MISLYFRWAFAVQAFADCVSRPKTQISCFLNEAEKRSYIPLGIPAYFIFILLSRSGTLL